MFFLLCTVALFCTVLFLYLQHPQFGKAPNGNRLAELQEAMNYKDGEFHNIHPIVNLHEDQHKGKTIFNFLFKKIQRTRPTDTIPSVQTDLKSLPTDEDVLIWFGHSSYFIQLNGKRFLVDPVFSDNASPVPNTNRAFNGSNVYTPDDMPYIDYLLITHDHYDHLDYSTVKELKPNIGQIICGLGVGAHFEHWKFDPNIITEKNWYEDMTLNENISLHTAPARHFSGRSFSRNNTLWLAFILQADDFSLYLGGDGGYDTHFAEIGQQFNGFDLAILENGQYNKAWHAIHLMPEEGLRAARDLRAKRLFPVHSSKFKLAHHPWDEPLRTITTLNEKDEKLPLITPKIGEIVFLRDSTQQFDKWWEGIN